MSQLRFGRISTRPVCGEAAKSAVVVPIQRFGRARIFPNSSKKFPSRAKKVITLGISFRFPGCLVWAEVPTGVEENLGSSGLVQHSGEAGRSLVVPAARVFWTSKTFPRGAVQRELPAGDPQRSHQLPRILPRCPCWHPTRSTSPLARTLRGVGHFADWNVVNSHEHNAGLPRGFGEVERSAEFLLVVIAFASVKQTE